MSPGKRYRKKVLNRFPFFFKRYNKFRFSSLKLKQLEMKANRSMSYRSLLLNKVRKERIKSFSVENKIKFSVSFLKNIQNFSLSRNSTINISSSITSFYYSRNLFSELPIKQKHNSLLSFNKNSILLSNFYSTISNNFYRFEKLKFNNAVLKNSLFTNQSNRN